MQDLKLKQTEKGYFDLVVGEQDFETVDGFDTTVVLFLFTDARATATEASNPANRRGWIGNLFRVLDLGSLLWLMQQVRNTREMRNKIKAYTENALQPLIDDGFTAQVVVNVEKTGRRSIKLTIELIINGESRKYEFWLLTDLGNLVTE